MLKKEFIIRIVIIITIFLLGFLLRLESLDLSGIPANEKSFYESDHGLPYMYDMDSYYNLRLTQNYLDHGYIGDTKINGVEWDLHSYYPPGVPMDYPPLIVYLTAFLYKFINLFSTVPLIITSFWLPAIIGPLAGVITFLFVRRFTNNYGAAAAGVLAVTAPFYFMRTVPGFFDTDMFNIIFPILIVWCFIEGVQSEKTNNQILFTVLSAFFMFLFSLAWNGWQYMFYIIIISSILWLILLRLRGEKITPFLKQISIFVILSLLLTGIFSGYLNILKLALGPLEAVKLVVSQNTWVPWPNVYILVSELQQPALIDLLVGLGPVLLGLGIFGIISILIRLKKKKEGYKFQYLFIYLFLLIWTIAGLFTLLEGIRFFLLLIPPLTVISGLLVGVVTDSFNSLNQKNIKTALSILLVILIAIPSIIVIQDNLSNLNPRMNDDMWNAGIWINNNTNNNTVIVSSWVYGHFFTAIADRPVVTDGRLGYIETMSIRNYDTSYTYKNRSPNTAREYWIDKALSIDNETLSTGILRMLSTSGDTGFLTLDQYTKNTTKTVEVLNNILGVDNETAYNILTARYGLDSQEAKDVLNYTHTTNPKPAVLVTYDDMINYGYWIFDFGEWNFNNSTGGNFTYSFGTIKQDNNTLTSDDGLKMDLDTKQVTWNNLIPFCVITVNNGTIQKQYLDNNSNICVVLLLDRNQSVIIDKRFENSTFTKLVLEKINQTSFKALYQNNDVIVWQITGF